MESTCLVKISVYKKTTFFCRTKDDSKPWCFLKNVRDPSKPTMHCYRDVKWSADYLQFFKKIYLVLRNFPFSRSATYGSFYSSKACEVLKPKDYPPRKRES